METPQPLGNLCQCLTTLTGKKHFLVFWMESHVFQFVTAASCPVNEHYREESGSLVFISFNQIFIHIDEIPPGPFFLQTEKSKLFQSLFI